MPGYLLELAPRIHHRLDLKRLARIVQHHLAVRTQYGVTEV